MSRFYSIVEQDVCVMNESTTQARVATMKSSINIIVEPKSTLDQMT
jgi:hypothetical protein